MTPRRWLRAGLVLLAVVQGLVGGVQLLLPRTFYDDFPAPGHPWVALLPPYNEHLMRDVGALNLANVVAVVAAAATMDALMVRTALVANLVFAVPHLVFHATHLADFPRADAIGQTVALVVGVAFPAALLALSGRAADRRRPAGSDRPTDALPTGRPGKTPTPPAHPCAGQR